MISLDNMSMSLNKYLTKFLAAFNRVGEEISRAKRLKNYRCLNKLNYSAYNVLSQTF